MKAVNTVAAKHDIELCKGKGYFYWIGTTDEMWAKVDQVDHSEMIYALNHITLADWIERLTALLERITEEDKYL